MEKFSSGIWKPWFVFGQGKPGKPLCDVIARICFEQSELPDTGSVGGLLSEQRAVIQHRLMNGASGAEVAAAQTDLVDGVIIGRYRHAARQGDDALMSAAFQHCCLVALGGYGRREMAPYSDVDLMVLYRPDIAKLVPDFVRQVLASLVGYRLPGRTQCSHDSRLHQPRAQ